MIIFNLRNPRFEYLSNFWSNLTSWPKVGIVVLNWNNFNMTVRCLDSLMNITYPNYVIYLVDNRSEDGSGQALWECYKNSSSVRFVFNEKNLGFSAGCNKGIVRALEEECDYVLLLNNDCIIYKKDFLQYGVSLAESEPCCGIVGGKILFYPDTKRIWSTGGHITFLGGERYIGYREIDKGQYDRILKRGFISGALMLIKRKVFDKIGLLPEVYFFGKEDWEFSTHVRKTGFILLYHPCFSVYHEASSSHNWTDPTYIYNGTLSKILYKRRNFPIFAFRIWFFGYSLYLRYFFGLKYSVQKEKYLQNVSPDVLRWAMMEALINSQQVDKIDEENLNHFREKVKSMLQSRGV